MGKNPPFYSPAQRQLQAQFHSEALATRLEELIVHPELDGPAQEFVHKADYFFLSTVSDSGFPSVSYKGGDPGFVKIMSATQLAFPCYDGNGMYYSMGNIAAHAKVGLLFIDFETPNRLRIEGTALLSQAPGLLEQWPETALACVVDITHAWINCPRYIHPMQRQGSSEFVPRAGVKTPQPEWKSSAPVADVVPQPAHTLGTHGQFPQLTTTAKKKDPS
ncbi:MAG: pyridoxamine 5'-phosphate oxidase family protein [bacterium]